MQSISNNFNNDSMFQLNGSYERMNLKVQSLENEEDSLSVTMESLDTKREELDELLEDINSGEENEISGLLKDADNIFQELASNTFNTSNLNLKQTFCLDKYHVKEISKKEKKQNFFSSGEENSDFEEEQIIPAPVCKNVFSKEILKLRYSQDSIANETMDGLSIEELVDGIKKKWKKGTRLTVVRMPDDQLVSLDNRRLYAAKQICRGESKDFSIPVTIYHHLEEAPKKLLRGIVNDYRRGRSLDDINNVATNIIHETYGHCIVLRMHTRIGDLSSSKFGYKKDPTIRD